MGRKLAFMAMVGVVASTLAMAGGDADAAKKKSGKRSDYSKSQQAAFFKEALSRCRKKYKSRVHKVEVDYRRLTFVCYVYD